LQWHCSDCTGHFHNSRKSINTESESLRILEYFIGSHNITIVFYDN